MAEVAAFLPAIIGAGATAGAVALAPRPKAPKPQPITRMPDENAPEILEARRRKLAERQSAGGRESTILSDDSYSNNLLGE